MPLHPALPLAPPYLPLPLLSVAIPVNYSLDEYLEKTHELLIKAVDKRMLAADVPIGVLLSGTWQSFIH
jgi:asparagine synthetase B (glutamine-hydrolysing)